MMRATAEASPNLAITKYWGKRDKKLMLPTNSSISATFGGKIKTRTTVMFSDKFEEDELFVNGKKLRRADYLKSPDIIIPLDILRKKAGVSEKCRISSFNTFPTSAGFASSAAGLCAFAYSGAEALGLSMTPEEISVVARMGSGSATRSVMGGFVEWTKGEKEDGSDSKARQIKPASHWPEFRIISAVVSREKKKVGSRAGMAKTVETSPLYRERMRIIPERNKILEKAIIEKDEKTVFKIAMRDSMNMHAVMLDTFPPIIYLNDVSKEAVYTLEEFNKGGINAGYTFDAGPNIHVFTLEKHEKEVEEVLKEIEGVLSVHTSPLGSGPEIIKDEKKALLDDEGNMKNFSLDEKNWELVV